MQIMREQKKSVAPLVDRFGRHISYLRLSVTDRCDFRCTYCMAERMTFLPKNDVLTLEELDAISTAFIRRGVRKIRITGGEPLVRPNIMTLFQSIGQHLGNGLDELTLTTNATQLSKYAADLFQTGVRRINVSLDSLNHKTFNSITRRGDLDKVVEGITAARQAGLKVKINMVALKDTNEAEIIPMIEWCHAEGMDITLIEVMPMGDTGEHRFDQFLPLSDVRRMIEKRWTLSEENNPDALGGPSRYVRAEETGGRIGFITPLTDNFCASCNRVRVTCTGRIYMCLGQEDHIDLRSVLRTGGNIDQKLDEALFAKPEKHEFQITQKLVDSGTLRHMSTTGG